ncbi:putative Nitrosoguanidine resistance protein SNG1 [Lepidopterella palustris CBS 459.81]|uniref:Putative Nitrosoguanidine resistance protein SNG1 n=1 Tax=Lepidopterella palustris CBS 459.81 TaxID=1314670 RepID=A0A8E2E1X3_9PEZI|nr:putative Nitrosoguanidine resistance protein SNG1 [Lepidopterella palustris CBS 459.81]
MPISQIYSRAHENRHQLSHPALAAVRKAFFKAAGRNFLLLQILFLALFAYIFGSIFEQGSRTHNLKVLFVDYDDGTVGASIRNAYKSLKGDSFPSLVERSMSDFLTPDDLRREVCDTHYWAAIYTSLGASGRLQDALMTGSSSYDKDNVLSYIWNEARYPAVIDSSISANLLALSSAARIAYANENWTFVENSTSATFSIFADPWHLTSVNIQPTAQGARLIYNTIVIILIVMQEFFYLGTINNLYEAFKVYSRLDPHRVVLVRFGISAAYTCIGSLCTAGAIWAFRAGWNVNGNQFVLSWLVFWLFAHVNFLTMDVFTVWLPPWGVPMALISWVIFNITSILLPFELSPKFYRWAYVMPAHEVYQVLVDIWSGGCNPQLSYALPVLFILELSSLLLSALGVHRRSHYAIIKEEADEKAFQMRVDTAIKIQQQGVIERTKTQKADIAGGEITVADENERKSVEKREEEEEEEREEISDVLRKEDSEIKKVQSRASQSISYGPAFGFLFGAGDGSSS